MKTITLALPEALSSRYTNAEVLQDLMLKNFVVAEYQKGNLSVREAAEILDISYTGFIDLLGSYQLSFINADKREIQSNFEQFQSFINQHK